MTTKSSDSSKKFDDCSDSQQDSQLLILQAKREAIFELIQNIYDASSNIELDVSMKENFLAESANIVTLRNDFHKLLDDYNTRLLVVNPTAKPNYKCLVAFEQLYSRIQRLQALQSPSPADDSAVTPNALNKSKPKLPLIELDTFTGDIRQWPGFYACFKSTIHDNPTLTNAEKICYLLGKLSGKAETLCLSGIKPCAENYELILQTLIDKYEDKRVLASAYLDQMFEFKPLATASSSNFDLFNEQFISAVRALSDLKIEKLDELILVHIALKKLDSDTVHAFELSLGSEIPTFEDFESFLKNRAKVFERTKSAAITGHTSSNAAPINNVNTTHSKGKQPPKYQAYVIVNSAKKCLCANITHQLLSECPDFHKLLPAERFKIIRKKSACVNCTSIKHKALHCKSGFNCRSCKSRHHSMLHFKKEIETALSTDDAAAVSGRSEATVVDANTAASGPPLSSLLENPERTDVALCTTSN